MSLGNLPSSIANSVMSNIPNSVGGLQSSMGNVMSMASNGNVQVMSSSIPGMNNVAPGSSMIMTNSNMNAIGGMTGGSLVVTNSINKAGGNGPGGNILGPHHLQNGPMLNTRAAMQHMSGPRAHAMAGGPRMQAPPNMTANIGNLNANQGMGAGGNLYGYGSPGGGLQNVGGVNAPGPQLQGTLN